MADEKNETPDPIENNLEDKVLVDSPGKLAHEDQVPETQEQLDAAEEADNLRDGSDVEGGKTARELHDERAEAAEDDK
jgi:hypothetical protein